ncbi:hypothetical protein VI817_004669 [Penicillium citrinum]|nr:hypothetical protein VI817_004669 [Penicillium citrinum]
MTGEAGKYTGRLKDTVVLIVGGTLGIGYAIASAALEHMQLWLLLARARSNWRRQSTNLKRYIHHKALDRG